VKRIIIENVWEFMGWGPVDPRSGKPIKSRKGEYFHAWIDTIRRLGFEPEWRKLNAADYGDATMRQRFILMARSDRKPVSWPMPTHTRKPDGLALFPGVKPWRPAREQTEGAFAEGSRAHNSRPPAQDRAHQQGLQPQRMQEFPATCWLCSNVTGIRSKQAGGAWQRCAATLRCPQTATGHCASTTPEDVTSVSDGLRKLPRTLSSSQLAESAASSGTLFT
jgi:site-specific DNA-cytosine methylase